MTPHQIASFYTQLFYYQNFSKALRISFRKCGVITMSIELRCEIVNTDKRDKKRTKHYLKNLCIHHTPKHIVLIRGEVEFSRKIKILKGKDIKNKTAGIEMSVKVRAYE